MVSLRPRVWMSLVSAWRLKPPAPLPGYSDSWQSWRPPRRMCCRATSSAFSASDSACSLASSEASAGSASQRAGVSHAM